MELAAFVMSFVLHIDQHLAEFVALHGAWVYALLFAVVFIETGVVVMPFLPGDSLLFAVGALAATEGSPIDVGLVAVLLIIAAVVGDAVNYAIGKKLGPKVFTREDSRLLNKEHLLRAHRFYEKHGGKAIIIARFVPIVRTFAPFVAGIGQMNYFRFALFNVTGGIVWVLFFLLTGHQFGRIEWIQRNFALVTVAVILISVVPVAVEFVKARRSR